MGTAGGAVSPSNPKASGKSPNQGKALAFPRMSLSEHPQLGRVILEGPPDSGREQPP